MSNTFTVFKGSESGSIKKSTTTKPDPVGDEVLVKITASGLCGTDEHYRKADIVLGHEGVGVVEKIGPDAKNVKVGDRVGWGYQHDACMHCQQCFRGTETFCSERKMYGVSDLDQGSFAHKAIWREAFLFKIPDNLPDEAAAPLQCGGATVFNALHYYPTPTTARVGIVGIGGLGHLAIQFAAKMGCEVVVFSSTDSKKEEAMKLGANEFVATKGAKSLNLSRPVDRLLVTTSFLPDWDLFIPCLAPEAVIIPLTVADGDFKMPYMPLLQQGLTIQGSLVASRWVQQRMLNFAAHHQILPMTVHYPMTEEGIERAMNDLNEGKIRYRAVLFPEGN